MFQLLISFKKETEKRAGARGKGQNIFIRLHLLFYSYPWTDGLFWFSSASLNQIESLSIKKLANRRAVTVAIVLVLDAPRPRPTWISLSLLHCSFSPSTLIKIEVDKGNINYIALLIT